MLYFTVYKFSFFSAFIDVKKSEPSIFVRRFFFSTRSALKRLFVRASTFRFDRIIRQLFRQFKRCRYKFYNPKVFAGFTDITVLFPYLKADSVFVWNTRVRFSRNHVTHIHIVIYIRILKRLSKWKKHFLNCFILHAICNLY